MAPYYALFEHPFQFAAYLLLITAIISLWVLKRLWVWIPLTCISLGFAFYGGIIQPVILIPIGFLAASLFLLHLNIPPIIRTALVVISGAAALGLFSHMVQGTHNLLLFQGIVKKGSAPYSLYWNYDKGIAGLLLLAIAHPLISDPMHFRLAFKRGILWAFLTIAALMGMAYGLDLIRLNPSVPPFFPLWLIANLFFVAVAEEALFRGLLQKELTDALPQKWGWILSILIVSSLFALAHLIFTFDMRYVLLSFGAGLFYGLTFSTTQSIEASIVVHFLVNATHILFFSYPYLA